MYHDNFRFFLRNAISEEMEGVDFIFVLTKSAMGSYSNVVSYLTGLSQTQFRFRIRLFFFFLLRRKIGVTKLRKRERNPKSSQT